MTPPRCFSIAFVVLPCLASVSTLCATAPPSGNTLPVASIGPSAGRSSATALWGPVRREPPEGGFLFWHPVDGVARGLPGADA